MPRRFNKAEIDEWRQAGKSHTCAACCDGNCEDCQGTCDCSDCHGSKGASVLDALESRTARPYVTPEGLIGQQEDRVAPDPLLEKHQKIRQYIDSLDDLAHQAYAERFYKNTIRNGLPEPEAIVIQPIRDQILSIMHGRDVPRPDDFENDNTPANPYQAHLRLMSKTAAPVFDQPFIPQATPAVDLQKQDRQHWGDVYPCPNCGHAVRSDFQECPGCGERSVAPAAGVGPAGDQPQPMRWAKVSIGEASMPPQGAPVQQKETALPYNPGAYEGEVEGMHPAAQYTYQRAVAQGAAPQAAMAAAQEKQGEMMKRTQEGQNIEGVQIPVISGFVPTSTVQRVSHLT